ncbi:hypothetical protein BGZ58_003423 [Dissophora ornata]|nr:hypothetical protein BGZ58_003423 [Dissophora ornata]
MALMQSYLIHPDDPDSETDIAMQIMISQAAVDSKGFEVLLPQTVESIKRHHATLSSRIAALTARLSLESKIREAAQSLLKLHADNKKLARQASDHLEAANRKVDQVATELWKLTQLAADLQRTLLQHTSGVLAFGVVRLEDQGRRERDMHVIQIQDARVGQDVEEQFETMAKVIMSLESDALEAQSLLEDKDRAIERLMKQLEHQRDLFVKLDEQQQKTTALSQSHQKNMDTLNDNKDAKTAAEMTDFLNLVQQQLQRILQQQQQQQQQPERHQKQTSTNKSSGPMDRNNEETTSDRHRAAQAWPSETTLISTSSGPSNGNVNSNSSTTPGKSESSFQFSIEGIRSTLDVLESRTTESQQKMQILEGELGLLRRQSQVLSASRNNSIKIKNFSTPRGGQAEETIRAALEKSLKDALLAKEVAQLELENERQRWQEDQNHRISALEESLVAVEDMDKKALVAKEAGKSAEGSLSRDGVVQELRKQLREAIDEIDVLNNQQQSSLKSMRLLFDLIPDSRRKSHMQLYSSHQQLQQQIASSPGGAGSLHLPTSSSAGSVGSILSPSTSSAVGFSMESLISRVKELVGQSQQVEQDNVELRQQIEARTAYSHQGSSQNLGTQPKAKASSDTLRSLETSHQQLQQKQERSTWILNTDLERLQASAGMVQLLEKELDLLKQHTDMLLDENARLADLAAANTTNSPAPSRSSVFGGVVQRQTRDDALDELEEIIRVKDKLLRERDELVQKQEKAIRQIELDMAKTKIIDDAGGSATSAAEMSSFDVAALEDLRRKCGKLEEEAGEMRMIVAALESLNGGPGSGSQILKNLSIASNSQSPLTSWFGSSLGIAGSASHGSVSQIHSSETASGATSPVAPPSDALSSDRASGVLSPGGNNSVVVAGATAALRKEFRRAMGELRDEKEKAVRKEVEERRRLEREARQLRRELQTIQISVHA